ncbi:fibronectin type III domain-containing protein [Lactococcus sp. NH2-7C]|uniref:fibronectin type III domain-containing protein n=1 Tax=Lactococcus sp. NH2-7C TaxID=2879149 RepID=UPI001CDCD5FA|nr:fibronectin type III domain-containing protein [Lactococcus sp. NH2-7C]MCA2388864.1 fibronectin type III domain-containing protein [Lactococcus sp. NH2-7C]WGV30422.1 fibronectin type III domain-containing protein [Lactococcus sp. NH2-7C]
MADKNYLHTAYANSADGTDGFTTVYPNLNLLDGTRDFSGTWGFSELWTDDGTYNGLTVKKRTGGQWGGIFKKYTVIQNSDYTFSAFVKGYGTDTHIVRIVLINGVETSSLEKTWTSTFDWERDSITFLAKNIKVGDEIIVRYEISVLGTNPAVWTAGHKWETGSTATPYMPSSSEVTTADWPKYVGTYVDTNPTSSAEPSMYDWDEMKYRVYLDGVPVGGSKLLSFDLENLKAGTSYNVQVNQINGNDESDKSESVAFKTTLTK